MQNTFGTNLKAIRQEIGLSQTQLAQMIGVSFKTISHWEKGYSEPTLEILGKLKSVLKVSYEDLLD